jgi:Mrp family chromosome partitioning ATPase
VPWGSGPPMASPVSLINVAQVNGSGDGEPSQSYERIDTTADLSLHDLVLLPGGSPAPDPPTLLGAHEFKVVLGTLKEHFDIVLIDSPPLLSVSDALPMLGEVDGTLLVSRVGTTTEESAKQVAELVNWGSRTRLLGVVANDVQPASLRAGYGASEYAKTG